MKELVVHQTLFLIWLPVLQSTIFSTSNLQISLDEFLKDKHNIDVQSKLFNHITSLQYP